MVPPATTPLLVRPGTAMNNHERPTNIEKPGIEKAEVAEGHKMSQNIQNIGLLTFVPKCHMTGAVLGEQVKM